MLHTYLKPHEAKQNDVGERLIGSGLVSAQLVGSPQEAVESETKVCCSEFAAISDLRIHFVRTSAL